MIVQLQETFVASANMVSYPFETELAYFCGPSQVFTVNQTHEIPFQTMKCGWNKTWGPADQLFNCKCECSLYRVDLHSTVKLTCTILRKLTCTALTS